MSSPASRVLPIGITAVTKTYGSVHALDNVTLDIAAGEFVTLLGPSGSGKTTLLMVLAGFVRPDSGIVRFGDADVTLRPPHRRNVGMVFQNYALFPHMSVLQNVAYPLRLRGVGRAEAERRAAAALEMVHLTGFDRRRTDQLSGGQQQRVALARAMVFEPPILLMDEPLSALDKKLRDAMQVEIRRLHERVGTTTVYVTHDQREALAMSDRVAVINGGRLVQVDAPDRIYGRPANLFVADFIGDSHFLPVEVQGEAVLLDGRPLRQSAPLQRSDGPHVLVLRPEKLEIIGAATDGPHNLIEGTVRHRVFLGEAISFSVALDSAVEISVKVPTRQSSMNGMPAVGERIRLGLHPDDTIILPAEAAP